MTRCRAILSSVGRNAPFLFLGILLAGVVPARDVAADEPMKPHGGISGVRAFDVRIHVRLESRRSAGRASHTLDADSDWSGVVRLIGDDGSCEWTGPMQVRASARGGNVYRGDHVDSYTFSAEGSDEQSLGLVFYEDGTYRFGFGHAQIPGRQSLECSAGKCTCNPDVTAFYSEPLEVRLPIPRGAASLSGTGEFTSKEDGSDRFTVTWSFTPEGAKPPLKAVPKVAGSVRRGEPLTLDGGASTGRITEYRWTFSGGRAAPDGSMPDLRAELRGAKVEVTLLEGMRVKLTVTDGEKTDSRSMPVAVMPRPDWKTAVTHASEEGRLVAPAPMSGRKGWEGGENVCDFDPPASLDEPVHILHPQSDGYTLAQVSDQGPYAGFSYVGEWKVEAKRRTLLNKWIVEDAPPILAALKSFYLANVDLKTDVVAYLAAARRHERMHTTLIAGSVRADDPAKFAERAHARDAGRLRRDVDARLKDAEKAAAEATKDPLARIWTGKVAVPTPDTGRWTIIETDVGSR